MPRLVRLRYVLLSFFGIIPADHCVTQFSIVDRESFDQYGLLLTPLLRKRRRQLPRPSLVFEFLHCHLAS